MSADISALGGLKPVEPLNMDAYADNKETVFQLPPAGRYVVQAPSEFPAAAFSRTKRTGALSAQVDPIIQGPTNEGFQIRFQKVSATTWERDGQRVSQLGDYLRACGFKGTLKDEQEQADAVEATANTTYQVDLEWRAYNKRTGFSLEGMKRFPKLPNGGYQSWVEDPTDKDEEGNPVRVRANLQITRFVPAGQ